MIKVSVFGRLVADVTEINGKDGKVFNKFTIASRRDKDNTDFIDCISFNDTIGRFFHKGDKICIYGNLNVDTYKDKDGNNKKSYQIVVDGFEFAENKKAE